MSSTPETPTPETREFRAETRQLLDIVIHSLYSNKEIFLRELVSNASDALDRLRFEALTDEKLLSSDETLEIRLIPDVEKRTLTIADNGVGMSREEVIENLGTIAKSGTREMVRKMTESGKAAEAADLIGQFGVGFYSAFMVADRVTVLTRRSEDEKATRWESSGDGTYEIHDDHRFQRGTTITLHLRDVDEENGIEDYTRFPVLQRVVKRHSDFVAYPIVCVHVVDRPSLDESGKPVEGERDVSTEESTLNSMRPLWTRPKNEVTEDELADLYRHVSHDWTKPLDTVWVHAEGRIEYRALLFLPESAPHDLYWREGRKGLQLFVRRVMIMENCEELLPPWLRFVRGVVESADLPLSISRETVHQDRHIVAMRKFLTKKVLERLGELLRDDREKYAGFFEEMGRALKEGVASDYDAREKLAPLLLFESSHDEEKPTTLAEYVERMGEDQEAIYWIAAESRERAESSPHLEAFRAKGIEVLYFLDPVDEVMATHLTEFDDKPLKSAGRGEVELGSEEEREKAREELEETKKSFEGLLTRLQSILGEHVKEVRLSSRLTSSPSCLVGGEFDVSPQLEKILRQTGGMEKQKRILELNPKHDLLVRLEERFEADAVDPRIEDGAWLLLGIASLAEGSEVPDPQRFNRLVAEMTVRGMG